MRLNLILAGAAIAALTAGAALAQSSTSGDTTNNGSMNDQATAPSAGQAATPAAATVGDANAPVTSSPTAVDQAYTLKAGDPNVVSNGPVPDTPQNRKLYGPPMSNAGRHTAATGD
jgi:hypothetical protein